MAATFAATALAGQAQEKTFSIIPEPVEITVTGQGEYLIQRNTVIRMSEPTLAPSATYLADYMERYLGIPLQVELPKSGKSRKKLSSAVETILSKPGDQPCIILKNQKNGEIPGGYQLEITPVGGISLQEQLQKVLLENSVQKLEITLLNYELERNRTKISK